MSLNRRDDEAPLEATRELLAIPGMRESILEAMAAPLSECFETLEWDEAEGSGLADQGDDQPDELE